MKCRNGKVGMYWGFGQRGHFHTRDCEGLATPHVADHRRLESTFKEENWKYKLTSKFTQWNCWL